MPIILEPYRTKQLRKVAGTMGFDFHPKDERGLYQLVRDCSLRLSTNQLDHKCVSNIMTHRDHWDDRITYIFDILTASREYPLKTMILIRSKRFDFPFTSLQPNVELFPPRQRIRKRRRSREIHRIIPDSGNLCRSHTVFTTDPGYWPKFRAAVGPYASARRLMFLEVHNFFFFFIMQRNALYTTHIESFLETGRAICDRVSGIGH